MNRQTRTSLSSAVTTALTLLAAPAAAQIPDTFVNLQALAEDISKPELVKVMKSFSLALGVRCQHCHVGGDGRSLKDVDFASDEDPDKRMARFMMRMTRAINGYALGSAPARSTPNVEVTCKTCHRGRPVPRPLGDELAIALDKGGLEAATARYRELRKEDYGRGRFDFGEDEVADLAERRLRRGETDVALGLLRLNVEHHPKSARAHLSIGAVMERRGRPQEALKAYRKALSLRPGAPGVRARIRALESKVRRLE